MTDPIPGYVAVPCPDCRGTSTIYLTPNLLGFLAYGEDPGGREVDCTECGGSGVDRWRWIGDTALLDTAGSASRQHYIDTGRYLTHDQVAEYAR